VPGGVTQVKEVAAALIRVAKTRNITTVLVGHVTKDGSIAGPRVLEHVVDVVPALRGRPQLTLPDGPRDEEPVRPDRRGRLLRPGRRRHHRRHRPDRACSSRTTQPGAGTCVAVTMEGRRPMLAEVQALVTHSAAERPPPYDVRARLLPGRDGDRRPPAARAV
jgi:DNA repair protein RadA/Sms